MAAPGNRLGQVARVVILVGLALLALGNAVEAIGIWGWSWNGSGRYLAPNQSLVQTHELGRLGSTLRELLVVAGVLLVIANVAHGRGSSAGSHRRRAPTAPLYATSRSSAGVAAQAAEVWEAAG
jgi:hypothetical protein